jgi:malic enzyme
MSSRDLLKGLVCGSKSVSSSQVKPNILIGLAGAGKLFKEEVLTLMGQYNERPIIMPMSNPTHKMECNAEEAQRATGDFAIPPSLGAYSMLLLYW